MRRGCVAALALALAACPAPRRIPVRAPPVPLAPAEQHDEPALAGVVHVVQRGETVYRIARAYGIDPADLMETNGIADPRTLAVGTELFVPGAPRVVEVPPAPVPGDPAPAQAEAPAPHAEPGAAPPQDRGAGAPPPRVAHPEIGAATGGVQLRGSAGAEPRRAGATESGGPGAADPGRTAPVPTTLRVGDDAPLAWPLKGVLYGRYGVRAGRRHDGIDIAAPEGTVVTAAAPGTVIYAGEQSGYGSIVILKHDNGLVTLYAHASRVLVEEGARVQRGAAIARVGQTGRTTGPHLHFEVREGARPRNPLLFLP